MARALWDGAFNTTGSSLRWMMHAQVQNQLCALGAAGAWWCAGSSASPALKSKAVSSSTWLYAVLILSPWCGKSPASFCFDNQGKWTLHLIAFLLAVVGSSDFISGPAGLFAYQPFAFLQVLSLFPLRLCSWLNCLLTAHFFHRSLLHFLLSWNQCCRWCASLPSSLGSSLGDALFCCCAFLTLAQRVAFICPAVDIWKWSQLSGSVNQTQFCQT